MTAAFNPYHKWLGIPPEEQPAHHYRLLGIKVFETDADVIESAADQRMAHLRTLASGKNAELSQKLLNEISAAKVALLNPEKRAAYDQKLRQALAAKATPAKIPKAVPLTPVPVASKPLPGPDLAALPNLSVRAPQRKRGVSPALLAAIGGGVALLLLVGVLVALNSGSGKKTVAINTTPTPDLNLNPTLNLNPPPAPPPPPPAPTPAPPSPTPPTPVEPIAVESPESPAGAWTDLLSGITLPRDAVRGAWKLDEGQSRKLLSPPYAAGKNPLIKLDASTALPAAYDVRLTVERLDNLGGGINLIVPIEGRQAIVMMDGFRDVGNSLWAIERVDGRAGDQNDTRSPGEAFAIGKQVEVLVEVRPDRITATSGDQRTQWQGSPKQLSLNSYFSGNTPGLLLGVRSSFAIHRLESRPAQVGVAEASPTPTPPGARTVVTPLAAPLAPALGTPIDLLARISAADHAVKGKWRFDGMVLVDLGTDSESVLEIPFTPPSEYDLKIEVERKGPYSLGLGLLADGRPYPLRLDGRPGGDNTEHSSGLRLDGKWYWDWEDPTAFRGQVLPSNKPTMLVFNVRKDRLRLRAGAELIFDCALNPQQSQPFADWKTKNPQHLNLAANKTQFRFTKLELIPLGAGGESIATASDAAPAKPVDTRPAPPDEARQGEIRKSLNEIYKLSSRRTPAEKRQLAGELMTLADDTRDKPAERYVFLREVQRLATEAGDFDLAHRSVQAQGEFAVDALLESGRLLVALAAGAREDIAFGKLVDLVPPWVERALLEERFDEAEKLLDATARAVAKPAGRKFAKPIVELRAAVTAQVKQRNRLQAARDKLAADPADPEANLALGSWLCFMQGNWNVGLPHLAKGSDTGLKACAAQDLAALPKTADEQIALGDAWWDLAQKTPADEKAGPLARADHWYRIASAGSVVGLTKAKLDNRLEETQKARAASSSNSKTQPPAKGSRVLIVMANKDESKRAQQACQRYGMASDAVKSFDREQVDYSAYHTIICGSNDMNYWGNSAANKDPAAFNHIERFVYQGGHLIVCGTFNGVNMEHLKRFGIYTGFMHSKKFEPVDAATNLLFAGVEDLVPANQHLQSAGHFSCYRQHVVLLKRGAGSMSESPALTTSRHEKGRLTFSLCEPHWQGDMWFIDVLLNWASRGAPTP